MTESGGDGWEVKNLSDGTKAFATSYNWCEREQTVALLDGATAEQLDGGLVSVLLSEDVRESAGNDNFYMHADLCADAACSDIVTTWSLGSRDSPVQTNGGTDDPWLTFSSTFSAADVAKNARFVRFADGGDDGVGGLFRAPVSACGRDACGPPCSPTARPLGAA